MHDVVFNEFCNVKGQGGVERPVDIPSLKPDTKHCHYPGYHSNPASTGFQPTCALRLHVTFLTLPSKPSSVQINSFSPITAIHNSAFKAQLCSDKLF